MKQVLIRHGQVINNDVPAPLIEDGFILVEVAYSLISSGTEVTNITESGKPLIRQALEQPAKVQKFIKHLRQSGVQKTFAKIEDKLDSVNEVGYSCSGTVLQVGNGVTGFQVGDRVACGGAGLANHAEVVLVPSNLMVKIPDGCSLKDAASVTLGAIAMQGVRRADSRLGEIVAVIGLGLLGQITVQLLKASGCQVIGIDIDQHRLDLGKKLGADYALRPGSDDPLIKIRDVTNNYGVDCTIITAASSSNEIVQQAMEITRKKGRVILVGSVGLNLKRSPFYEKEIDFLISSSYGPGRYDPRYEFNGLDYPLAYVRWTENRNMIEYLRLVAAGKVRLDLIYEREYTLEQASQAYAELQNSAQKPLGIILRYQSGDVSQTNEKLKTSFAINPKKITGKLGVAVVGAGNFSRAMHLPNLQKLSDRYHIHAIVDRKGSQARITAQQFGAEISSTNYDDVLNDPDTHVVFLTTRHNLHAKMAIQAAKAGKAIFVEKPMALNFSELEELECVLRETGAPFMVGFNRRFSPAAQRLKEMIAGHSNPIMMQYRMNAGFLPPDHWTQTDEGGGRIIGEACHILDLFKFMVGPARGIEICTTSINPTTDHFLADDNRAITIRYEDGSVSNLLYTSLGSNVFPKEYLEVYVDGKVFVIEDYYALKVFGSPAKGWSSSIQNKGHFEELTRFADYVQEKSEAPIPLDDLIEVTRSSFLAAGIKNDN